MFFRVSHVFFWSCMFVSTCFIVGGLFVLIEYSKVLLSYNEKPRKVDAIVLLMGPKVKARTEKAKQLLKSGYSDCLLIPAHDQVVKNTGIDILGRTSKASFYYAGLSPFETDKKPSWIYENTHIEVIYAKRMMDALNFTSAIFVSSPFHMMRVKLISRQVFKAHKYKIYFDYFRYVNSDRPVLLVHIDNLRSITYEYIKIAWFLLYAPFCE